MTVQAKETGNRQHVVVNDQLEEPAENEDKVDHGTETERQRGTYNVNCLKLHSVHALRCGMLGRSISIVYALSC